MRVEQVEVDGSICLVLREVHNGLLLETEEGNRIAVSMRDDTFEIAVLGNKEEPIQSMYRVNMKNGNILPTGGVIQKFKFDPLGMSVCEDGSWFKTGVQSCQHHNAKHVGEASVYECSCGQRVSRGFTPKEEDE